MSIPAPSFATSRRAPTSIRPTATFPSRGLTPISDFHGGGPSKTTFFDGSRVARPLHNPPTIGIVAVAATVGMVGCLAPPIEPEPEELNLAPFLDFIEPENSPRVTIDSPDPVTFSVRAFDANESDETLYFLWFGEETDTTTGQVPREPGADLEDGVYYQFQRIERTIFPCDSDLRGVSRETLWLYVADGEIDRRSETEVVVEEDNRKMTSYTWILDISPAACL